MDDKFLKSILDESENIAVVGLSSKTYRASYGVSEYLQSKNYKILPVNPFEKNILGEKSYNDLRDIPLPIDIVDIFRKSEDVLPIIEICLEIKPKLIFLQEGVINQEAFNLAKKNNIPIIMDKCLLKEHMRVI